MSTTEAQPTNNQQVPRMVGLLVIEVRKSNINGDPEREGAPRQRPDRKGEVSPPSVKRKMRDLMEPVDGEDSLVWQEIKKAMDLGENASKRFQILESRGRKRDEIDKLLKTDFKAFQNTYWDGRLFGNTFLEENGKDTTRTGVAQIGIGVSVAPVEIEFQTWTSKSGVEADKDRGMAPMAMKVTKHAVYVVPFFINPSQAKKTGCKREDVEVMLRLIKNIYSDTRSVGRAQVEIVHAHVIEHNDVLGSFSDFALLDALTPKRLGDEVKPSESLSDYTIPTWETIKDQPIKAGSTKTWAQVGKYTDYGA